MSALATVGVLMPGDMGHAVGRALRGHGHRAITGLAGRSERSRRLAAAAGLEDAGGLEDVVAGADLILSILPPASAPGLARDVAKAMTRTGKRPVYVDCNAISPATVVAIAGDIAAAGAPVIDAGIIGTPPGPGSTPRFYVSGADLGPMLALHGQGLKVIAVGAEPGRASALKMCYAGLTKGTWTLHTAVLLAAESLGLSDELRGEFETSQKAALAAMEAKVPRLPADAGRWIGEMEEIAKTFAEAGVTPRFHEAAADIFRLLNETPFADETRETIDATRTAADTIKAAARLLGPSKPTVKN
jgi:3-hydroxyisobutyrate dehydrogenase-like beta-hydroxyacid dehydrogenase